MADRKQSFREAPPLPSPAADLVLAIVQRLDAWETKRSFPWRDQHVSPFQILVAEILLTRTPAEAVAEVVEELWSRFPTPADMAGGPAEEIAAVIKPLGLAKRAGMLMDCAQQVQRLGGVPTGQKELRRLPGVGSYVGDAVRVFAFGETVIPVDAVIGRVVRRALGYPSHGPAYADRALWRVAQDMARGSERPRLLVDKLLDLGSLVCVPSTPRHDVCPLAEICVHYRTKQTENPTR